MYSSALLASSGTATGITGGPWLRLDGLALVLSLVALAVTSTVVIYARRNLAGTRGTGWFFAGTAGVLAGTLGLAMAGRLSVLLGAWVLTSLSAIVVLGHRGDRRARTTAARAARSLLVADLALLGASVVVFAELGDVDLSQVAPAARDLAARQLSVFGAELGAGTLVALLLAVAALVRAAQLPLHRWLPGTVNAPTPVSALLHAGVVNAGGFMLVRLGPLFGEVAAATWLVVLVTTATILWSAGRASMRHDVKGVLAISTSAQMGFMLLACALGAPVAAISHLVGHGLYKSSRFLGAGGAIRSSVTTRRFATTDGGGPDAAARIALSVLAPAVALGVGWVLVGDHVLKGPDGIVLGSAIAVTTSRATWLWTGHARPAGARRRSELLASVGAAGALAGLAVAYLVLATGIELAIVDALDRSGDGYVAAPLGLGILGVSVGLGVLLTRWERTGAWLAASLTSDRTPRLRRSRNPVGPSTVPTGGLAAAAPQGAR